MRQTVGHELDGRFGCENGLRLQVILLLMVVLLERQLESEKYCFALWNLSVHRCLMGDLGHGVFHVFQGVAKFAQVDRQSTGFASSIATYLCVSFARSGEKRGAADTH